MTRHAAMLGFAVFWPLAAAAHPPAATDIRASYTIYAAGLPTARVEAEVRFSSSSYLLRLNYRTTGLFSLFDGTESKTLAQGRWSGEGVAPFHYASFARIDGAQHRTVIAWRNGSPQVRLLVPDPRAERQAVPAALQRNSIDTLSAMALLIRRVQESGRCEAHAVTFDGRRAIAVSAHTAGIEALARSGRGMFAGAALRCDFQGRQIAGFRLGHTRQPAKRGSAWLARVVPGGPPIPVRLDFETRWFGEATAYLTAAAASPPTIVGAIQRLGP